MGAGVEKRAAGGGLIGSAGGSSGLLGAAIAGRRAAALSGLAVAGRRSAVGAVELAASGNVICTLIFTGGFIATAAIVRSAIRAHALKRGRSVVGPLTFTNLTPWFVWLVIDSAIPRLKQQPDQATVSL